MARHGRAIGIAALLYTPITAHAQAQVNIVQIWQNFVASAIAAKGCNAVDKNSEAHFRSNLTAVTIRAIRSVKQKSPTTTEREIATRMTAATKAIGERVKAELQQRGCTSPNLQQLLKMYRMHAAMKL